jgi:hypothetical protein
MSWGGASERADRASVWALPLDALMRLILGVFFLLYGVGLWACSVEWGSEQAMKPAVEWVRTVDGWERSHRVYNSIRREVGPPRLHPLIVAAGQGLASVLALVACGFGRPGDEWRAR